MFDLSARNGSIARTSKEISIKGLAVQTDDPKKPAKLHAYCYTPDYDARSCEARTLA